MMGHLKVIWRLAIWFLGSAEEIGCSIQCVMLVGVMKLARDNPTLETNEIEKSNTP